MTLFLNVQFAVGTHPPFVLFFDWLNANTKLRHDWLRDMSINPLLGKMMLLAALRCTLFLLKHHHGYNV